VIAYFFHQNIIDAVTGGHDVTRQEQPRLYNLLENLCISRGIPMPKLKIVDNPALNAFATGLNRKQYAISVTTGLMNALNDREMEAVLGHELTHIRNGDVQLLVIAVVIAGVVGFFAELFFRIFFNSGMRFTGGRSSSDGDKKGGGAFAIVLLAIALIGLAWACRWWFGLPCRAHANFGGCRFGRTDQGPGCDDLGAAQDRGPGELPGATSAVGNVHRQPARGLCRPVRDSSLHRSAGQGPGQICRRA
jgi:heat shock protein HtpX